MAPPSSSNDTFYKKVINPYLPEVMKYPQVIEMCEGVLHIWDVQGPKKEGSEKARLATVEQEIFKCEGMVERGLNANHSMITNFIHEPKMDNKEIGEIIFKLYDRIQDLQAQIYDLQNQNCFTSA
ncbi:40S ribosomal protein S5-1 [Hordeum vulgare]|nr:40S ribosomal protein S5-1 [Hordeum vulgare]